jgi:type II pantothenate kinase
VFIIFKQNTAKIQVSIIEEKFLSKKVGIDIGQSLTKIAYIDGGNMILSIFPTKQSFNKISEFLEIKKSDIEQINITGGKAYNIFKKYEEQYQCRLIDEFEANAKGIEYLFQSNKNQLLPHSLIVTIGTGTSIVLKKDDFSHIGGTALGGGFFMGLSKLLFNIEDYQQAIETAKKGNRYNVDLKVSDIYPPEDDRIDLLFREFTAASLGKIDLDFNRNDLKKEDLLNSIICMIGENIGTLANLMADNNEVLNIVFCGGFLRVNRIARKILSLISKVNKKRAIFLNNSEFCGAIGALFL